MTGGSSGIGPATARAFLDQGAAIAICGRSAPRGQQAVEALSAHGDVEFFAADVTEAASPAERQAHEDRYRSMIAMRRIGEPSGIADAVLWLCSSRSSYATGQVITVDGALGL